MKWLSYVQTMNYISWLFYLLELKISWKKLAMEPQDLITWSLRQKGYQVNKDTLEKVRQLKKPVVVIGITGPRMSGKTYLMNQIAGKGPGKLLIVRKGPLLKLRYM